jgi:GNAT superfamily N-acetyltransferase
MEFGLIGDLVVLEEYRKRGYGTELLSAAEQEAKASNVKWLRVGVLSENRVASELYLSRGFSPHSVQLEKALF